ncbi:MAG: hypothetical protein AAGI53_07800 [Planctomycetota bacterium]
MTMERQSPNASNGLLRRLGYLAIGIAIGIPIAGYYQSQRKKAVTQQQQERAEAAQAEGAGSDTPETGSPGTESVPPAESEPVQP